MIRIGLIGAGNIGSVLLKSWSDAQGLEVSAFDLDGLKLEELRKKIEFKIEDSSTQLTRVSDYIILAVKPAQIKEVITEISSELQDGHCLISVAAGIRLRELKEWSSNKCPVVRVMPNTPALVGQGVFALCLDDDKLSSSSKELLKQLFAKLGQVHVLAEDYFDAFTALMGSGPAYVFYFMESLIEAGVTMGFTRQQSTDMVLGLIIGSAKMVQDSDLSVGRLREMVSSPAGTTVEGLNELDRRSVRSALIDAVMAACRRSRDLGKSSG